MKALSLRQPWAHAVIHLGKNIENRRWNTRFRGTFLIHAAKGMTRKEYDEAVDWCADVLGMGIADRALALPGFHEMPRGGFVGVARLVGVIPPCKPDMDHGFACPHPWHMPEQYGFVLEDVRPLPFVPMLGALGFQNVPQKVLDELRAKGADIDG